MRRHATMGTYVLHEHTFVVKGTRPPGRKRRPMQTRLGLALPLVLAALLLPGSVRADPSATVAALQVGLHAHGLYRGPIDGIAGPLTKRAVRALQRRARIAVDGVPGPRTRRALGRFAAHRRLGVRPLHIGLAGWDVAAMQFELAEHGFASGTFDGIFGPRIEHALRHFQKWAGLHVDGIAGIATLKALRAPPPSIPLTLAWPLTHAKLGDPFGPRGDRFHTGIDLLAPGRRTSGFSAAWSTRIGRTAVGVSSSQSTTDTVNGRSTRTCHESRCASASGSARACESAQSERPATRPDRICTSRCACEGRRSIR